MESYLAIWQFLDLLVGIEEYFDSIIVRSDHIDEDGVLGCFESMEVVFWGDDIYVALSDSLDQSAGFNDGELEFVTQGTTTDVVFGNALLVLAAGERILRFFEGPLENFIYDVHFGVVMQSGFGSFRDEEKRDSEPKLLQYHTLCGYGWEFLRDIEVLQGQSFNDFSHSLEGL